MRRMFPSGSMTMAGIDWCQPLLKSRFGASGCSSSFTRPFQFLWGACTDEYSLRLPFILNGVLARPSVTKFSHTLSRNVDALNRFDKMQVSITLHLENPKW